MESSALRCHQGVTKPLPVDKPAGQMPSDLGPRLYDWECTGRFADLLVCTERLSDLPKRS